MWWELGIVGRSHYKLQHLKDLIVKYENRVTGVICESRQKLYFLCCILHDKVWWYHISNINTINRVSRHCLHQYCFIYHIFPHLNLWNNSKWIIFKTTYIFFFYVWTINFVWCVVKHYKDKTAEIRLNALSIFSTIRSEWHRNDDSC